ncbi:MAG: hypothetical protein NTX61_03615 [Bacteroidetes bacterium]|nr:hypothetical protein [Bacteroidota bacterium]
MKELNERQFHPEVALDSFKLYLAERYFSSEFFAGNFVAKFRAKPCGGPTGFFCFFSLPSSQRKEAGHFLYPMIKKPLTKIVLQIVENYLLNTFASRYF